MQADAHPSFLFSTIHTPPLGFASTTVSTTTLCMSGRLCLTACTESFLPFCMLGCVGSTFSVWPYALAHPSY